MKLRNKKTGDVFDFDSITDLCFGSKIQFQATNMHNKPIYIFNSLAELNKEWEDYKEPKDNDYWYIDDFGRVQFSSEILDEVEEHPNNWMTRKLFGNYFGTREEAEKAMERLKAWKRLKDKCCISFSGLNRNIKGRPVSVNLDFNIEGRTTFDDAIQNTEDLMLLFGGEDESNQ